MAVFKCKMCGGTLEFNFGETVGICDSCGTKQTLPKLDDDKKVNLYDRANHFRRANEFDKAMSIYELILNEDNTDAEAYWSLVLCRYGIEYVEDPSSHKRIPTVNRAQFTSIFADEDYRSALQYADGAQREVYEKEAKAIDEIQKGILEISSKEEPFDVFICYKETDNNGKRTPDSVLAAELYHELTDEGFKVFFSRITLEDKLGTAYEPYIFAALNSAKVMVVLGTKPEYFNAVWVKNEWKRYLALIQSGKKKMLIPAYKDMDPYDLPEEFSHLQGQDMSKLGFMQDLIYGIKKITNADERKETIKETIIANSSVNVSALLKRVFIFLEDGDWDSADEYCEKVLDADPENANAYLGKLMAEMKISRQENLADCKEPFDNNKFYQKVIRYADEELRNTITGYIMTINERNELERLKDAYNKALSAMKSAKDKYAYRSAACQFKEISGYLDSEALAANCIEMAEIVEKEAIYEDACYHVEREAIDLSDRILDLKKAIAKFKEIPDYKNSREKISECQSQISELELAVEEHSRQLERQRKRKKIITTVTILSITACIGIAILLIELIIPSIRYNNAVNNYYEGNYDAAVEAFTSLGDFKDSADKINEVKYAKASELFSDREYDAAVDVFKELGSYSDSADKINEVKYAKASELFKDKEYDAAVNVFEELGDYSDSVDKINEVKYAKASELLANKNYKTAYELFGTIISYSDSEDKYSESGYNYAVALMEQSDYEGAIDVFGKVGEYSDSAEKLNNCYLESAKQYYDAKEYAEALKKYKMVNNYDKNSELYKDCTYHAALKQVDDEKYTQAVDAFQSISGYKDSDSQRLEAMYKYVMNHKSYKDVMTYIYIKELKSVNYKDSVTLFNTLYVWKAEIIMTNQLFEISWDEVRDMSSISRFSNIYISITLFGGIPKASTKLKYTITYPDGSTYTDYSDEELKDGRMIFFQWDPNTFQSGGSLSIKVYDGSGNLIGENSVKII